ncbi:MAG: hypothetical protein ACYDBT_00420 [Desulfobulbaceae bacterium]
MHFSELATDILREGEIVTVKVLDIDQRSKSRLSMKAVTIKQIVE